ncbi:O-antigen ligase family protein [Planctomycetaceae bacterium SH139]
MNNSGRIATEARPWTGIARLSPTIAKVLQDAIWICAILLINRLGQWGNIAFLAVAVGYLLQAKDGEFKAFVLVALAPILNELYSVNGGPVFTAGRFLVYGIILICLYQRCSYMMAGSPYLGVLGWLIIYVLVCLVLAFARGYFVEVSAGKLFTFAVGTSCVVLVALLSPFMDRATRYWVISVFLAIAVFGIFAWLIGQGYNGKGLASLQRGFFNGPLYHSNTTGPICAMIAVALFAFAISEHGDLSKLGFSLLPVFFAFAYLTKSRTSIGAALIGMSLVIGTYVLLGQQRYLITPRQKQMISRLLIGLGVSAICLIAWDSVNEGKYAQRLASYISKTKEVDGFGSLRVETILESRIEKYEAGWGNFKENPITGIGFGTASGAQFARNASMFSAPIEKGFIGIAVLEETGIVGAIFFLCFVGTFLRVLYQQQNYVGFALLATYLVVNCGETMFFSFGGHGAFGWAVVMCGIVLGARPVSQNYVQVGYDVAGERRLVRVQ